jgi:nucleoside-diphosphate-sugar epimerase
LQRLAAEPPDDHLSVVAFVHPSQRSAAEKLAQQFPFVREIKPFDLAEPVLRPGDLDGIDVFLHTAAVIHVEKPSDWLMINHGGTTALANAACAAGVRRFVFLSSNAAGGRNESSGLMDETMQPRPRSLYGESKLLSERTLRKLEESGRFDVVILRPSMFYGPPVPSRHVDIYKRILSGTMPMVGDGNYRRSITYIDSLVQATMLALTHPNAAGQTYYIVDEPVYTTRSIVEAMASALGATAKFITLPAIAAPLAHATDLALARVGLYVAPVHLLGEADWDIAISCAKARREIGYTPTVELEEGMQRAVAWCREQRLL